MLTPILCFTCGFPTGDYERLFLEGRARLLAAAHAADPDAPQPRVECRDLFARLGVFNDCCRMRLTTAVLFHPQLHPPVDIAAGVAPAEPDV